MEALGDVQVDRLMSRGGSLGEWDTARGAWRMPKKEEEGCEVEQAGVKDTAFDHSDKVRGCSRLYKQEG